MNTLRVPLKEGIVTISQILRKNDLFKFLSDDQLKAVIELGEENTYLPGAVIFRQEHEARTLYVLLHGRVSLLIDVPEEFDLMADTLQETGSVFGTSALAGFPVYGVTARCKKGTTVLSFDAAPIQEIIRREPALGIEVMAELARLNLNQLNIGRKAITGLFRIFKREALAVQMGHDYRESTRKGESSVHQEARW
jgi:CRP-like cAMP-binding protein